MDKLGKALVLLGMTRATLEGMTLEQLVRSITARPHDFEPGMFSACFLQNLVRVAQEQTPKPAELTQTVVRQNLAASRIDRLAHA